jgi:ATP-dependent exoDNAse (exonuclease V) beta subunit
MPGDADPTTVSSVAVTVDDVVTALEANWRSDRRIVLRITPPFSARMRARLHRPEGGEDGDAVHLDPERLVDDPPPYPHPDETRDPDGTYAPERHHERHTAAVRAWRRAVAASVADAVDVPTDAGDHRVEVKPLG